MLSLGPKGAGRAFASRSVLLPVVSGLPLHRIFVHITTSPTTTSRCLCCGIAQAVLQGNELLPLAEPLEKAMCSKADRGMRMAFTQTEGRAV